MTLKKWLRLHLAITGILLANAGIAGPADYVLTPNIKQGELELDASYGAASNKGGARSQVANVGLGYGVSDRWFSELMLKLKAGAAADSHYVEWENRFRLTAEADAAFVTGFVTELEAPLNAGAPWELKVGPMFQMRSGSWQWNGNVLFSRAFGGPDEQGVAYATNLGYQWQAEYRRQSGLDFGMQGFGEVGAWDRWDTAANQNHRIGPALFGEMPAGGHEAFKFNAAWLFGLSQAAPQHTLRIQLEREL
jgi:hypothetical protein